MSSESFSRSAAIGVGLNVLGSALFVFMSGYTHLLKPLTGEELFGWRLLLTLPCLTVLLVVTDRWKEVIELWGRILERPAFAAGRVLSSLILTGQVWMFMWAPLNGYALDVSLGYFLLPIFMVVLGRALFGDKVTRLQAVACSLACVGIAFQLGLTGTLSWPAMFVCLGYPGYFVLRRISNTNTLGALWFDMLISMPISVYFVSRGVDVFASSRDSLPWLIVGLGAISAGALACHATSAARLSTSVFGLLLYIEPVLLLAIALVLGESIPQEKWPTYGAIWAAVLTLVLEGALLTWKRRRRLT
jgi:chloramphenicol-sensitive protein RarD